MEPASESRVRISSSGLTISTSADSAMSPAVTWPAPCLTSLRVTGCGANERRRIFFMLSTIWVTSSLTAGIVLNSWNTFAIWMEVTAAPSSEDSSTRRSALPSVTP